MGLAERRVIQEYQDNTFPTVKQEIDQIVGFDIPLEVNWSSFEVPDEAAHIAIGKIYFTPLVDALKSVCADDMGKQAVKTGLNKIVITNNGGSSSYVNFTFKGGVLTIDHLPHANSYELPERTKGIKELLESGL